MTVREFMNYLKYIEYSAENLQFFLWYRDFSSRWDKLSASEKALAPEWSASAADADIYGASPARPKRVPPQIAEVLKNTDFADGPKVTVDRADPFYTPPKSGSFDDKRDIASDYGSSFSDDKTFLSSNGSSHRVVTEQAFDDAGMKWKPCMPYQYNYPTCIEHADNRQSRASHTGTKFRESSASTLPRAVHVS